MLIGDLCEQLEPSTHRMWCTSTFDDVLSCTLTHFGRKRTIQREPPQ
jgi:hypothetical protein